MKHLILVRHAKSSWKDASVPDHDRPLGKRGKRDAPFMAEIFRKKNMKVDLVISSTANRALTTAQEFAKKLEYKKSKILRTAQLYAADLNDLLAYVKALDNSCKTIMIFGHNPGITGLANFLSGGSIDNIPTCGIVALDFEIAAWSEADNATGNIRFYEYPKLYFKDAED